LALGTVAVVAVAGIVRKGSPSKKSVDRARHFTPRNEPRWVRIYDNGGQTADRYTVVFTGQYDKGGRGYGSTYLLSSENPYGPNGIGLVDTWVRGYSGFKHDDGTWQHDIDRPRYSHLGKKIGWKALPPDVRKFALEVYADLWKLEPIRHDRGMPIFDEPRISFRSQLSKKEPK
jgi:hypothetical protein